MHEVTRLALRDFEYKGRPLELLHAHTGAEARRLIHAHRDIAVALVDVVMESEHAGLDLVRWVREAQDNHLMRIILRTGQPGQAPERRIIVDYDINDYKEKTELTSTKLFTLMVAALRGYENLHSLDRARSGLLHIIESSDLLLQRRSLEEFIEGVLLQCQGVMSGAEAAFYSRGLAVVGDELATSAGEQTIVAGTGEYAQHTNKRLAEVADSALLAKVDDVLQSRENQFGSSECLIIFENQYGGQSVLYLGGIDRQLDATDRSLIQTFCLNTSHALNSLNLNREIEATQREVVYTLGRIAEFRSNETGKHIERVAKTGQILALLSGMDRSEAALLEMALPMHDIGKIAIPDEILHKPGPLDDAQWAIMKTHAELGYNMLKHSQRPLYKASAIIAREHHEWWNGVGYPRGLKGEQIHIYGRIAAIADVFDALGNKRCYKAPWPTDQIIEHFKEFRGVQFDPMLTDLLLDHIDLFIEVRENHNDDL